MKIFFPLLFSWLILPFAGAQTWIAHTPPFPDTIGIADIHVVNANVIWAVGLRYGVDDSLYYFGAGNETFYAVTSDGGATWKTGDVPMGTTPFIANITATDAGTALIIGLEDFGNAKTLKTTDGGVSWQISPTNWDPVVSWPNFIHAFSPAKMCTLGDPRDNEFEIYTTANAGQVWQRVAGDKIPDPLAGEFGYNNCGAAIGNTIWFGTNQGRIFRSQNSGAGWEVFNTPLGASFAAFAFSDENNGLSMTGYGLTGGAQMYKTGDGGATWTELTNLPYGGDYLTFGTAAYIPGQPYILQGLTPGGNLSGPYETWLSPDRGETWQQISSGEIIGWPTFINNTVGWAGEFQQLSHPARLFKYTGSPLVGLLSPGMPDVEMALSPNPATNQLQVNIRAPQTGDFWILLNDAQGRLIKKEIVSGVAAFNKILEIKSLPSGTYILTLSGNTGSMSRQFVKY